MRDSAERIRRAYRMQRLSLLLKNEQQKALTGLQARDLNFVAQEAARNCQKFLCVRLARDILTTPVTA